MKVKFKLRDDEKRTVEELPEQSESSESTEKKKRKSKKEIFEELKQELSKFNQQIVIDNPPIEGVFNIFVNNILAADYGSTDYYEGDYDIQAYNRTVNLFNDSKEDAVIKKSKGSSTSKDEHGLHISLVRNLIRAQKKSEDTSDNNLVFNQHVLPQMMAKKFIGRGDSLTHRENTSLPNNQVVPYMIKGENGEMIDSGARIVTIPYKFIYKLPKHYIKAINSIEDNNYLANNRLGLFFNGPTKNKDALNTERLFNNINFIDITVNIKYYYYALDKDVNPPTKKQAIVSSEDGNIVTRFGEKFKKIDVDNIYGNKEKGGHGNPTVQAPTQSPQAEKVKNKMTYEIKAKTLNLEKSIVSDYLYEIKEVENMCEAVMNSIHDLIGDLKSSIMQRNDQGKLVLSDNVQKYADELVKNRIDNFYANSPKYQLLKNNSFELYKKDNDYILTSGKSIDKFNDFVLESAVDKLNEYYKTDIFETFNVKAQVRFDKDGFSHDALLIITPTDDLKEDIKEGLPKNKEYNGKPFIYKCSMSKFNYSEPWSPDNVRLFVGDLTREPIVKKSRGNNHGKK